MNTEAVQRSMRSYVIGFVLSIALTLVAYFFVNAHVTTGHHDFSHHFLIGLIMLLASIQLIVQLVFFLHLDREPRPYWNLQVMLFAAGVIAIVVIGSIWIMSNLNYRMMPSEVNRYMRSQDSL
jgi:cytochrome o ubiquinol oxidase subunit IV